MNCGKWQEAIALLPDGEAPVEGLDAHLVQCAACRELQRGLMADRAAVRAVPLGGDAVFDTIRLQVRQRIGIRSRFRYGAGAAIAAGIVAMLVWMQWPLPRPTPVAEKRAPVARPVREPERVAAVQLPPKQKVRKRVPVRALDWDALAAEFSERGGEPEAKQKESEVAMHIQTSNPDVVILLLKQEEIKGGPNE